MNDLLVTIQNVDIEQYAYDLPQERIAKYPIQPRDHSKLLEFNAGKITDHRFDALPTLLSEDSLLVYNNTKVIHARLIFFKETGARIELFCLEPLDPADYAQNFQSQQQCSWVCLIGNQKKWKSGRLNQTLRIKGQSIEFTAERLPEQEQHPHIRFTWSGQDITFNEVLEAAGNIPIPPYLDRDSEASDEVSYQTVYSRIEGSVAAPTAGLHFTDDVLKALDHKGVMRQEVTLHVGAGTFKPVQADRLEAHEMHAEFISVHRNSLIELLKHQGHIVAVGTTSVRTLESLYWIGHQLYTGYATQEEDVLLDQWYAYRCMQANPVLPDTNTVLRCLLEQMDRKNTDYVTATTRLLIAPGYPFQLVNRMLTNFHQPKSTLLLLVSAFVGEQHWKSIYQHAMANNYRFLSYGDSSLLTHQQ